MGTLPGSEFAFLDRFLFSMPIFKAIGVLFFFSWLTIGSDFFVGPTHGILLVRGHRFPGHACRELYRVQEAPSERAKEILIDGQIFCMYWRT